jgi:hypothetical protein
MPAPLYPCSISVADDLNGSLLSECEQLRVNKAATQLPLKQQQLEAIYINNAGHQLAGRRTDLAYHTWPRMAIFQTRAEPVPITMFNLATRQGKTAQGAAAAVGSHASQHIIMPATRHALLTPPKCWHCMQTATSSTGS